jgi:hypothetical protein
MGLPISCEFDENGIPAEIVVAEINIHETFGELSILGTADR